MNFDEMAQYIDYDDLDDSVYSKDWSPLNYKIDMLIVLVCAGIIAAIWLARKFWVYE